MKTAARLVLNILCFSLACTGSAMAADPAVAVLLVDTDHPQGRIDERLYGQFLEHLNHSVVDGLYAEQIRGQGFEGTDFADFWQKLPGPGTAEVVKIPFQNGAQSIRLTPAPNSPVGIRQDRIYLEKNVKYDGTLWLMPEGAKTQAIIISLRIKDSAGTAIATLPLTPKSAGWQEIPFAFTSTVTDRNAALEISAAGASSALVDFVSLMRADARANGKLRPDLLDAIQQLHPTFIRWPGGSFASIYKWQDGIGPAVARKYNLNTVWGNTSDYYGFGTDEFLDLCRRLGSDPLICLAATSTDPAQLEYAMNWVHYLLDPATTEWGKKRATNGHPEPYKIPYFQIDNEPMNHDLKAEDYAAIVNLYGPQLRKLAPNSKIVACGQKRSNDMNWTQKLVDIAGDNFDILGCHNYEYEPDNYATGVRRIEDYLHKARDYIRASKHPNIELAVLEWSLARTYDWRSGLHTAGSLISYEKLGIDMSCPALLMRDTTSDPEWRAWIYHDHVSWFAGSGFVAEKLFREHYAPVRYAVTTGTFADIPNRADFFDGISQMKPTQWTPDTVDAIATGTADGKRIVLKAVNYVGRPNVLLARLQGASLPSATSTGGSAANVTVTLYTISANVIDQNSLEKPDLIKPAITTIPYARDLAIPLPAFSTVVVEISGR